MGFVFNADTQLASGGVFEIEANCRRSMKKALHPIFGPISGGRYPPKGGFADVWIRQLFNFDLGLGRVRP